MSDGTLDLFADRAPAHSREPSSAADAGAGPSEGLRASGMPGPRVWTVRQVNRAVRLQLEQSLPQLWVGGEVTNFRRQRSGHCYFTLKDDTAQLRCVMFRREAARLPTDPREGMMVRVFGGLTLYEARGVYQLVVARLEAEGEGGMWKLAFDRLKRRLDAEGLTDAARKRGLPAFPGTVAVVTSPTGAALRDVIAVARRRAPWVRVLVRGTRVQGRGAGEEIAAAVSTLASRDVDVIVVARGGGTIEDLWGFNDEAVARAVASSPVPVVSGVGHETDVTICDLVADVRAATPSAAAEAALPDRRAVVRILDNLGTRLGKGLAGQARSRRWRLDQARDLLHRRGRRRVETCRGRLVRERSLVAGVMRARIARHRARLARDAAAMEALSPMSTLARGYAVPLDTRGRLLRKTADFPPAREFSLRVVDGGVACRVADEPGGGPTATSRRAERVGRAGRAHRAE
ncbi:MAG: exodeoxyribonuclease VII large subunit [Gemmatimonadota bacterium]|nr:exodeoxyribonuclease VII large subunit [Gemmatimonadota bacterium]